LKLKDWEPRSMMVTKTTLREKPLFPVVDMHNHLGGGKQTLTPERVSRYLKEMDDAGVRTVVNLDGGWDDRLKETHQARDESHPGDMRQVPAAGGHRYRRPGGVFYAARPL